MSNAEPEGAAGRAVAGHPAGPPVLPRAAPADAGARGGAMAAARMAGARTLADSGRLCPVPRLR